MRFKVEVDIDWINEDCGIDETVSEEIKSKLTDKVFTTVEKQIQEKLTEKISKQVDAVLDKKIMQTYDEFLSKGFNIYDRWGDLREENVNVKELLKKKLDTFMSENVDEEGRSDRYNGKPRYAVILDNQSQKQINEFLGKLSRNVIEGIKEDINNEAVKKITESILSDYSLKKLVNPMA
ncbi:hypothetical protein [Clostridium felsineum]|uniref:Uncharacterized protein n=1 Tax=Clostridium felsineum TaxID=36839 RepID=A0A1S8L054_9CLOT|nr:hypothetical protein [Clostridium felsineum]URZ06438.1 hypothetical protein CLROS_017710 [Clostridium felsineum]URZ11473.1 hypothetical protein CROST_021900 [Clostridium felsineum]